MDDTGSEYCPAADAFSRSIRFSVDCMLGKLARWLRILGFDTTYHHNIADRELLAHATGEKRLLLTRDRARAASAGDRVALLIDGEHLGEQLRQVIGDLGLRIRRDQLFSRCIECGGPIEPLPPGEAAGRVPDFVQATQRHFSTCRNCGKIYWNSTHVSAMLQHLGAMGITIE